MKLKYWPRYLARHALCRCRDFVAPAYPVEKVTADFFVSMGPHCWPAIKLRRHKLRICASPLDWMFNYSLADAAELFRTGFSTFFTDIRELPNKPGSAPAKNRRVEDVRNGMISIHHFPLSMSLEDGQAFFRERALRHFANTHRFMTGAERFVMVTNSAENVDGICRFLAEMKSLYAAETIQINIRPGVKRKREKLVLENNAVLYDYEDDATGASECERRRIAHYEWRRVLGKCRRTRKFSPPEKLRANYAEYGLPVN